MPLDAEQTNATLALTCELIRRPSVTPEDAGCLDLIGERLARCGFRLERFDAEGVSNLWATLGDTGPVFCFAGHTDVVPPGDRGAWSGDPFTPREREVLELVTKGKANKVIAGDLDVSQRTVEIHRARVMEKMGASSLAHLVRMVIEAERPH